MKKSILFFLLFIGLVNSNNAQISSVKYLIEYNESSSLYDCKLVIEEGDATTILQRIQFTAQYTVVVPTGAQLTIDSLYNPIEFNQNYNGTIPCLWEEYSAVFSPPSQPQNDFYSILPTLSPVSAYNDLFAGDTVTLFSISVDVDPSDNAVRPFINGVDPSSIEMPNGGDYSNGFAVGSIEEIYNGNLSTWYCNGWEVTLSDHEICNGGCVELTPNMNCTSKDLIYNWSTGQNTPSITVCPHSNTTYDVEITNPNMEVVNLSSEVLVSDLIVEFTGDDRLCRGETSTVIPNTGGTWISNNNNVAAITNTGLITAIAQGAVTFTFVNASTGCTGTTSGLIVDPRPSVSTDMNAICFSSSAVLVPSSGGTWEALNPEIATLSDNIVAAVSIGEAGFKYTSDATGCTSDILYINVENAPVTTLTGPNEICVGGSTTIEPTVGGTWSSDNISIATVDNLGNITGVGAGYVTFSYTSGSSLCYSEPSETVYVIPAPIVETPATDICIGSTMNLSPGFGGTWTSDSPFIATVNAFTGAVTALNGGTVRFIYTSAETGCSVNSEIVTVIQDEFNEVYDPVELCVGETSILFSILEGNWVSDNPSAINVDFDSGSIAALSGGTALLSFTSDATGCTSDLAVIAHDSPIGSIIDNEICVGYTTAVIPNFGGTWTSTNTSISTIDNLGNVTGTGEGTSQLTFTDSATGCSSEPILIIVNAAPQAIITGAKEICAGDVSSASPSIGGGTWTSNNEAVATIDNAGNITGLSDGVASFTFSDGQCSSTTEDIVVLSPLSIHIDTTICQGMNYNGLEESGIYTIDTVDGATGCDITITIDLEVLPLNDPSCTVGIEELPESDVKVYPNPTSGLVFIESESALEAIVIYTIDYQKIEDLRFTNGIKKIQINTDKLVKGLYILAIESRGLFIYKKLIIE